MENLEQERRFLIEIPLKWFGKFKVLTSARSRIYQTYLIEPGFSNARVRVRTIQDGKSIKVVHTFTTKEFVSNGVNKENEVVITQREYLDRLENADPSRHRITKNRYYIRFDGRVFEFDVFEENLLGLAILEIELEDMSEDILTPPYLKIVKEVTDDRWYSNINLATLSMYPYPAAKDTLDKIRFPRRND